MKRFLSHLTLLGHFAIAAQPAAAQSTGPLIPARPETVQISEERLKRLDQFLKQTVQKKYINGAVALLARDGKVFYHKAFGVDDVEANKPMRKDAIFRVASQTKAITSVAVMLLFEEGKLLLDDPVSKYIPAFKNPKVLDQFNEKDSSYTVVPAKREITIRDLLTHTSGIDYAVIGSAKMKAVYAKAGIPSGFEHRPLLLADAINRLAALPLANQPGEKFTYGLNTDVLGYLVEIVSGMNLNRFFWERIFDPLDMKDTYFYIPQKKQSRLVQVYTENKEKQVIPWEKQHTIIAGYPKVQGTYFSGGAGLSSTIRDYANFLQMLLNKGVYNGKRLLSKNTVELMTINQIGDLSIKADKFGLGFQLVTRAGQARIGMPKGTFFWGGFFGTTYWVDPKERIIGLLFTQQSPVTGEALNDKFRILTYQALEN